MTLKNKILFICVALGLLSPVHIFAQEASSEGFEWDGALSIDHIMVPALKASPNHKTLAHLELTAAYHFSNNWEVFGFLSATKGGGVADRLTQDTQGVSNIDAPDQLSLLEAWVKKSSLDGNSAVTLGVINLNAEFDVNEDGALFISAGQGQGTDYAQIGPSVFPVTGLGAIFSHNIGDNHRVSFGLFDAVPADDEKSSFINLKLKKSEGLHQVAEYGFNSEKTTFKLGTWRNSKMAARLDGLGEADNFGHYVHLARRLHSSEDRPKLALYARLGMANQDVQPVSWSKTFGATIGNFWQSRPNDAFGIGLNEIGFSKAYRQSAGNILTGERQYELTYQAEVKQGVILQPTIQWIKSPSGLLDAKNALVFGLRLRIGRDGLHTL